MVSAVSAELIWASRKTLQAPFTTLAADAPANNDFD
jgi:hypothetical protein